MTPPYLLLCFFVTCVAAACYELVLGFLRQGGGPRYVALGLGALQLCVLGVLIWTAGTYPLGQYWPGPNVARPSEVSIFVCCVTCGMGLTDRPSQSPPRISSRCQKTAWTFGAGRRSRLLSRCSKSRMHEPSMTLMFGPSRRSLRTKISLGNIYNMHPSTWFRDAWVGLETHYRQTSNILSFTLPNCL